MGVFSLCSSNDSGPSCFILGLTRWGHRHLVQASVTGGHDHTMGR
jgi:hypothetical protein